MLSQTLVAIPTLAEENGNVSASGIAGLIEKLADITVLLQRAHVKRVRTSHSTIWANVPSFRVQLFDADEDEGELHMCMWADDEESDPTSPSFELYDVDDEPTFCVTRADGEYFIEAPVVQSNATGVKVDWTSHGFGTFILDGVKPEGFAGGSGYLHFPGDACVNKTTRGASWD